MKKFGLLSILVLATIITAFGQKPASPRVTAEGKSVKVAYGQPSKRGREIFGHLEPYGKVWRTGANEATEITFSKDTKVAGKPVKAGTYTLFTIPNEKDWTIILNSVLGQPGAFDYEKNKAKDVVQVKVPVQKLNDTVEKLTFHVDDKAAGADLKISWDKTQVTVPLAY